MHVRNSRHRLPPFLHSAVQGRDSRDPTALSGRSGVAVLWAR